MLKIVEQRVGDGAVDLQVEGHVVGPWVEELRGACDRALRSPGRLRLELRRIAFLDPAGADLLLALEARGVALVDPPRFVAEQLRARGRRAVAGA